MASYRMEPLATSDVAGRPDTLQVMLHRGHAFVSHPFTGGFSVLDVTIEHYVRGIKQHLREPGQG